MTGYVVVLSVAFVVVITVVRSEQSRTDRVARSTSEQTDINTDQTNAITAIVAELEAETAARTKEGCENTRDNREASRETFFGILDAIQPKAADGQPIPNAAIDHLRQVVEDKLPSLVCPTGGSVIVIPTPSTTVPG